MPPVVLKNMVLKLTAEFAMKKIDNDTERETVKKEDISNQIIDHLDCRLDQIERLITLSLINDFLPQFDDSFGNLSDNIIKLIKDNGFVIIKSEVFSDKIAVYLKTERKVGIKELRELKNLFLECGHNVILVFELDKATATQKRKFTEEKISYHIVGKELFISKD